MINDNNNNLCFQLVTAMEDNHLLIVILNHRGALNADTSSQAFHSIPMLPSHVSKQIVVDIGRGLAHNSITASCSFKPYSHASKQVGGESADKYGLLAQLKTIGQEATTVGIATENWRLREHDEVKALRGPLPFKKKPSRSLAAFGCNYYSGEPTILPLPSPTADSLL